MLTRPRFIPISIAVLKAYGRRSSVIYGYCLSLGYLLSEYCASDEDVAAFMAMRPGPFKLAKRKLIKNNVIDADYTVLKPPVEPYLLDKNYYLPGLIFVPTETIKKLGFYTSLIFSFICQTTALTGGVRMTPQFWAWIFDKTLAQAKIYLYSPVWHGLVKTVRGEDNMTRFVPTEQGWKLWIWGDNTATFLLNQQKT